MLSCTNDYFTTFSALYTDVLSGVDAGMNDSCTPFKVEPGQQRLLPGFADRHIFLKINKLFLLRLNADHVPVENR